MSKGAYSIITAPRASNLIYEIAIQAPKGIWVVPDNVCPAVPLALACAGVELRFVDIDAATLCLDTGQVGNLAKTEDIAGVVYVRTYGANASASKDLKTIRNALPRAILIDDCCIGVPLIHLPENDGSADVVLFSTGYGKVLDLDGGAYGFFNKAMAFKSGGRTLALPAFEDLLRRASDALKNGDSGFSRFDFACFYGAGEKYSTSDKPETLSWTDIRQTITSRLPDRMANKAKLNAIYEQGLADFSPLSCDYQSWRFHIFVQNPDQTLAALFEAGLFASRHYAPVSKLWGVSPAPVSQKIAKNIINLFNDQHFTAKQAHQTVDIINEVGKPLKG